MKFSPDSATEDFTVETGLVTTESRAHAGVRQHALGVYPAEARTRQKSSVATENSLSRRTFRSCSVAIDFSHENQSMPTRQGLSVRRRCRAHESAVRTTVSRTIVLARTETALRACASRRPWARDRALTTRARPRDSVATDLSNS